MFYEVKIYICICLIVRDFKNVRVMPGDSVQPKLLPGEGKDVMGGFFVGNINYSFLKLISSIFINKTMSVIYYY